MKRGWLQIPVLALVIFPSIAGGDEAVCRDGSRFTGTLQNQGFLVNNSMALVLRENLRLVHFAAAPGPLPRCGLTHQVLLGGDQQLAGTLLSVTPRSVQFRLSTGETLSLRPDKLQGIVQADCYLTQVADDFEQAAGPSQWLGKPVFTEDHAFSGKKSLYVSAASDGLVLTLPATRQAGAGCRVTLHFYDPGLTAPAEGKIQLVLRSSKSDMPATVVVAARRYRLANGNFEASASRGWHVLQYEWHVGELRTYVDDYFLGSRPIPLDAVAAALHFGFRGQGGIWIDALQLAWKVPSLKRTPGPADLDEIWLASGDQIFGTLLQADETSVLFEAPFGRRTIPWSNVRGIYFRAGARVPAGKKDVEVRFRAGPGTSADRLTGTLLDLNSERLLLRHDLLGDFPIARGRLERIAFPEATAK